MLTICLPTRMWRWRISTRAWWIDLASPSLKTCVCNRRSMKSAHQSSTLKQALGILLIEGEQHSRSLADAGQRQLNAPALALVLEAELANELHLIVQALLLERTAWRPRGLAVVAQEGAVRHAASSDTCLHV